MLLYIIPVRFRHFDIPCRSIKLPMDPIPNHESFFFCFRYYSNMPRQYKRILGHGRRNSVIYPPERMQEALNAVHAGMGIRAAALTYGVPRSTLRDRVKQKHPASSGGQTVFQPMEERIMAQNIALLGDWGFPLDVLDVRMLVKQYLTVRGRYVPRFKENVPGHEWVVSFLARQQAIITQRTCRNITRKRAEITPEVIGEYFSHLGETLEGVPPTNIINFDETNLSDDPGQKKCVYRRGCKYPERSMNSTKASTSIMFAGTASGKLLDPYVVYKSEHLHDRWIEGGSPGVRYNRSRSGWFDNVCFTDWFTSVAVPYCRRLEGKVVILGDNLASHFSDFATNNQWCQSYSIWCTYKQINCKPPRGQ